jgi:hypothetical protein
MNPLKDFKGAIKLANAHPEIIKAVQQRLLKVGLLDGLVDGVASAKTLTAFAKFKKLEYLESPEILGQTTALALLEATESRAAPTDDTTADSNDRVARIPEVGQVWSGKQVYPGSFFTWGELTKGLERIPESAAVTRNLIKLAKHLDGAREFLGGRAITITSAYRPRAVNLAVGGASNSRHVYGDAADIVVAGIPPHQVFRRLSSWHGDWGGLGDGSNFSHLDLRGFAARWDYGNS